MQTCPSCRAISEDSASRCQCGIGFGAAASLPSTASPAMLGMASDIRTVRHVAVAWLFLSVLGAVLLSVAWFNGALHREAVLTSPYLTAPPTSRPN